MKRLTREERRRIQRRSANLKFLIFLLIVLSLGFALGYTVAHAQDCADQSTEQEVPRIFLLLKRRRMPQRGPLRTIPVLQIWN